MSNIRRDSCGEWSPPYWDDEHSNHARDLLLSADALLLGRKTYEGFVQSWPGRDGDYADRINGLPTYLASRTLPPGSGIVVLRYAPKPAA